MLPSSEHQEIRPASAGPVIGTIIVTLLLLLGALYVFNQRIEKGKEARNQIPYIPAGTTTIIIKK